MTNDAPVTGETKPAPPRVKFAQILHSSEPDVLFPLPQEDDDSSSGHSNASANSSPRFSGATSADASSTPYTTSPWSQSSPYVKSPWIKLSPLHSYDSCDQSRNGLIGSLVREEGHIYSLAASGDMLYTGSDSKNIRIWKKLKDFGGFKSNSGLVKAIVISGNKIFTGHQDGKIRIWKVSPQVSGGHKRIGTLPTLKEYLKGSMNPKSYVQVRRHRKVPRVKHFDAVSCLSLNHEAGLLYSGSWDKTIKVWRLSDSKCLESINAHDDAINSVAVGFDGLVFSGSADGTVKVWKRELHGRNTRHFYVQKLLGQQNAVTSLAVNVESAVLYSGSSDGLVNFWEREKHLSYGGVLRGHKLAVLCLATAGKLVLSGSADKSVCVWKREEGGVHCCLAVLTGHSGPVKCLAVVRDRDCSDNQDDGDGDGDDDEEEEDEDDRRWIAYSGSLDKWFYMSIGKRRIVAYGCRMVGWSKRGVSDEACSARDVVQLAWLMPNGRLTGSCMLTLLYQCLLGGTKMFLAGR
ncbi:hypothetical protein Ancab_027475 [Ancistrocladus abbreviatus]